VSTYLLRISFTSSKATEDIYRALKEVLNGVDPGLRVLTGRLSWRNQFRLMSSFIMHYLVCAHPSKETIKRALQAASYKRYNELDGRDERDYSHKCLLCFMTASDLAYVLWQFCNSYEDWCAKIQNQNFKHKCG
jgi:hypothetical protein